VDSSVGSPLLLPWVFSRGSLSPGDHGPICSPPWTSGLAILTQVDMAYNVPGFFAFALYDDFGLTFFIKEGTFANAGSVSWQGWQVFAFGDGCKIRNDISDGSVSYRASGYVCAAALGQPAP
jgi:hypothetical protein